MGKSTMGQCICAWLGLTWLLLFSAAANARDLPNFADLIEKRSPAVVKITTAGVYQGDTRIPFPGEEGIPPQDIPPELRRFLPRELPEHEIGGMGSGFIISKDGYVITNNHVVEGMDEITVRLQDHREFSAKVIGTDSRSDLALIKIDVQNLPFLRLADSDKLRVGEWVFAIGSPFGMDFSASQGIVSAIGRSIVNEARENYVPFIQTDVAINPGNSGGPLFNLDGDVVGINSQIFTRSGGYMGLSFAIPANVAKDVINQLKTKGRVDRGWLGVAIQNVDRKMAEALGLKRSQGALINQLFEDGPAAQAGLRSGDVILKFNGETIAESGDLPHVVGATTPGSTVPVLIMREKKEQTIQVEVGTLARNEPPTAVTRNEQPDADAPVDRLGVVAESLPTGAAEAFDVAGGVQVVKVQEGSAAADAGLAEGDIIVQLGFTEIADLESYEAVVRELPAGTLLPIRFFRGGQPVFRTITIDD